MNNPIFKSSNASRGGGGVLNFRIDRHLNKPWTAEYEILRQKLMQILFLEQFSIECYKPKINIHSDQSYCTNSTQSKYM